METVKTWDVKELAEFLGLSPGTVRDMARFQRIPPDCIVRPVGCRKWRFIVAKVIKWAKEPPRGHRATCEEIKRARERIEENIRRGQ